MRAQLHSLFRQKALPKFNATEIRSSSQNQSEKFDLFASRSKTQAGGRYTVTCVPGFGLGPELAEAMENVLKCSGAPIDLEFINLEGDTEKEFDNMILAIKRNGIAIKGNVEKRRKKFLELSANMRLRRDLDLYVNVMECKPLPGTQGKLRGPPFDIVLMRQNTEGEYKLLEHSPVKGVVEHIRIITEYNTKRLARYAFEYARCKSRSQVTCIHNIPFMPIADGLFLKSFEEVAERYPDVKSQSMEINTAIKTFVMNPTALDIIVCNSLFGGVFGSMLFGALGSPAIIAGVNIGDKYAVFEPAARTKGSALVGKNVANPTAMIMCGVAVLEELGETNIACVIKNALEKTMSIDKIITPDMGGNSTTTDFTRNVIKRIRETTSHALCDYDVSGK